jgi:hypothetical protein
MNALFTVADVYDPVVRALRLVAATDLALAIARIDHHHRVLCDLADWPVLRATANLTTAGANTVTAVTVGNTTTVTTVNTPGLTVVDAAGIVAISSATAAYWFAERFDVHASDLAGRNLWTLGQPARAASTNHLVVDLWDWNDTTGVHALSTGVVVTVAYWKKPATLAATSGALCLPSTRALTILTILDLVGLMDRKDVDVAPWRAELEAAMLELRSLNPTAYVQTLRLVSGRILTRGPSR